jgi:hypothetical protein
MANLQSHSGPVSRLITRSRVSRPVRNRSPGLEWLEDTYDTSSGFTECANLLFVARRRKSVSKSEPDANFGTDIPFSEFAPDFCAEQPASWPDEMGFERRALSAGS